MTTTTRAPIGTAVYKIKGNLQVLDLVQWRHRKVIRDKARGGGSEEIPSIKTANIAVLGICFI